MVVLALLTTAAPSAAAETPPAPDAPAAAVSAAAPVPKGRCAVDAYACVPEADAWIRSVFPPLSGDTSQAAMNARWRTIAAWSGAVPDAVLREHGRPTWAETVALYQTACDAGISVGCTSVGMAWAALALLAEDGHAQIEQARIAYGRACALKDDYGCLQVLLTPGVPPADYAGPSIPVLCGRGWDDACNAGR
jgi:hypothetical protein